MSHLSTTYIHRLTSAIKVLSYYTSIARAILIPWSMFNPGNMSFILAHIDDTDLANILLSLMREGDV